MERAFGRVGLDWHDHVVRDESFVRPAAGSVADLVGDPSRAREFLGWTATTDFEQLVDTMVDADPQVHLASGPQVADGSDREDQRDDRGDDERPTSDTGAHGEQGRGEDQRDSPRHPSGRRPTSHARPRAALWRVRW